jgi:cardiolipin synthase
VPPLPAMATALDVVPGWVGSLPVALGASVVLLDIAVCIAALGIIPGNRKPSTGMAWLILVLAVPLFGLLAFLLLGSARVERRRRLTQLQANALIHERTAQVAQLQEQEPARAYVASVASLNRRLGALPAVGGNRVELLSDYDESLRAMANAVDGARHYVHVQFYITAWDDATDPFFQALVRASRRGVRVRLLFDHLGSRGIPGYKRTLDKLREAELEWHRLLPIDPLHGKFRRPDLRNHRKVLVVDGTVAFAGSQNLIEATYDKPVNQKAGRAWVELMARLTGPAVAALDAVFLTDWYSETGDLPTDTVALELTSAEGDGTTVQVVPSGPGFVMENNLRMFTTLIYSAQRRISLTSPYFVPDESLLYAVTTAAQRGVDVELFVSAEADQFMVHHAQCSYYRALLDAGVRIYLYPAPLVLHSKHFTIDDDVAVIGSSNMDLRSFALNYEISLMLIGSEVVAAMRDVEDGYRRLSRELVTEDWARRPRTSRFVDNVMRLTSALQ